MRETSYTVTGQDISALTAALTTQFSPEETHTTDGVAVLMTEEYEFWRTNSNMQVTLILEFRDDHTCLSKLVVGGGASGLLNITHGSEKKILRTVAREFEAVCEDLGLTVSETP